MTGLTGHQLSSLSSAQCGCLWLRQQVGLCLLLCLPIFSGPVATWGMSFHSGSLECRRAKANMGAFWGLGLKFPPSLHLPSVCGVGDIHPTCSGGKTCRVTGSQHGGKVGGTSDPPSIIVLLSAQFLQPENEVTEPSECSRVPSEAETMIQELAVIEGPSLKKRFCPKAILGNPECTHCLAC